MRKGPRKLQINRQQKHILLLALFLLKYAHSKPHPLKRHVLSFIDTKNLILIGPEDRKIVATGEEAWANSIAFRRADLKAEDCLTMPDIGVWQITPGGERRLIEWCTIMNEFATVNRDWENRLDSLEEFFEEKVAITKDTVVAAQNAFTIAKRLFPELIPEVSPEMRGRIRL